MTRLDRLHFFLTLKTLPSHSDPCKQSARPVGRSLTQKAQGLLAFSLVIAMSRRRRSKPEKQRAVTLINGWNKKLFMPLAIEPLLSLTLSSLWIATPSATARKDESVCVMRSPQFVKRLFTHRTIANKAQGLLAGRLHKKRKACWLLPRHCDEPKAKKQTRKTTRRNAHKRMEQKTIYAIGY